MARVVSGVLLAAAFFALIWFGSTVTLLIAALLVAALAVREYATLAGAIGSPVPMIPTLAATWAALTAVTVRRLPLEAVIVMAAIVLAIWVMAGAHANVKAGSSGVITAAFAPIYIGLPLGMLVAVHALSGRGAVLLLIATVVASDTGQYYAGRTFGRRPLAPSLSPKKTIEGAVGGLILAPIVLAFAGPSVVPAATNQALLAVLGVALVVAGIAGDLFESMLKRAGGLKDSSALIPGHGGVLDRIDALLFATPVFYVYLREIAG